MISSAYGMITRLITPVRKAGTWSDVLPVVGEAYIYRLICRKLNKCSGIWPHVNPSRITFDVDGNGMNAARQRTIDLSVPEIFREQKVNRHANNLVSVIPKLRYLGQKTRLIVGFVD